jgi:hypothetical protein
VRENPEWEARMLLVQMDTSSDYSTKKAAEEFAKADILFIWHI